MCSDPRKTETVDPLIIIVVTTHRPLDPLTVGDGKHFIVIPFNEAVGSPVIQHFPLAVGHLVGTGQMVMFDPFGSTPPRAECTAEIDVKHIQGVFLQGRDIGPGISRSAGGHSLYADVQDQFAAGKLVLDELFPDAGNRKQEGNSCQKQYEAVSFHNLHFFALLFGMMGSVGIS